MTAAVRKPGRPRDPDLEARRTAEILDAAAALFADRGFANTHVQTLADDLGVGNGTIYRYFPTKEKLFLAAVDRGLKQLTAEMDAVLASTADPLEQMKLAIRTYLAFFHARPHMAELFIQERAAFPHQHRPLYFDTKDADEQCQHEAFFRSLVQAGVVRDMSQERFMGVVGDLLYGTILTNLLSGRTVDVESQTADVLDVILHGVLSEPFRKKSLKGEKK